LAKTKASHKFYFATGFGLRRLASYAPEISTPPIFTRAMKMFLAMRIYS